MRAGVDSVRRDSLRTRYPNVSSGDASHWRNSVLAGNIYFTGSPAIAGVQVFYIPNPDFKGREVIRYINGGAPTVTKTAIMDVR